MESFDGRAQIHSSLLVVLDEKNKLIDVLKTQIDNQKIQLKYYIRQNICHLKMNRLTSTCSFKGADENVPVDLAMLKFCNERGIKSRMMKLHDKMRITDGKMTCLLNRQQYMLTEIVKKIKENVSKGVVISSIHLDMLTVLLCKTVKLSRTLEIFRVCCDRLIIIEDEKNNIVEQVYSLPLKQRLNCNYLVSLQMEKSKLEKDIQRILKDQRNLQKRVKEIILMNRKLNVIGITGDDISDNKLIEKLKQLNDEAMDVLEKCEEQKHKFEQSMQSGEEMFNIASMADVLKVALQNLRQRNFEVPGGYKDKTADLYKTIISMLDLEINNKCVKQFNFKSNQCKLLKSEVETLNRIKEKLLISAKDADERFKKTKMQQTTDTLKFYIETSHLKDSVLKLEKLKNLYKQALHSKSAEAMKHRQAIADKNLKIFELQKSNSTLIKENGNLKTLMEETKAQMYCMLEIFAQSKVAPIDRGSLIKHVEGDQKVSKEFKNLFLSNKTNFESVSPDSVTSDSSVSIPLTRARPIVPVKVNTEKRVVIFENQSFPSCHKDPKQRAFRKKSIKFKGF